ncbi:MAG: hypothetical protein AB1652_01035 [Bacillota bacterium]
MKALEEEGLAQAEALVGYYFEMTQEEIAGLDDATFVELAARAYFYEERRALAVKRGVLMALAEVLKK